MDRDIWEKRLRGVVNKDVLEAASVMTLPATSGGRLDISSEGTLLLLTHSCSQQKDVKIL